MAMGSEMSQWQWNDQSVRKGHFWSGQSQASRDSSHPSNLNWIQHFRRSWAYKGSKLCVKVGKVSGRDMPCYVACVGFGLPCQCHWSHFDFGYFRVWFFKLKGGSCRLTNSSWWRRRAWPRGHGTDASQWQRSPAVEFVRTGRDWDEVVQKFFLASYHLGMGFDDILLEF